VAQRILRTLSALAPLGAVALAAVVAAAPASAQGRGRGGGSGGAPPHPGIAADPVTSSPATPQSRAAYLRSWLDDASVIGTGAVWAAVSFVAAQGGQVNFPVADMALGITPRTQAGMSVPVSRVDDGAGGTGTSVSQAFFYGKWLLRDASTSDDRLGVAVAPVIEIFRSDVDDSQKVSVGAPVNLEIRHGPVRAYGSVGFFSRGALFESAALEVTASPRVAITGIVGHTFSTSSDLEDHVGRHRTDLGVGASVSLNRALAVFGALGRSMTPDAGATWVAAGLSLFAGGR
jgi:hypothetical protein